MKDADLIQALKRIKVQTGGLICLGCGHEHNCGVHGCAVIREAAQRLEGMMKYKEAIDRMGKFGKLFVEYEGCPRGAMGRMCDATIQEEALAMDMLTDVDMGRWRPVNEDVLQDLLGKGVIETGKEQNGEPLTMEQLREMEGQPVWVKMKTIHELTGWAIVHMDYQMEAIRLWVKGGGWIRFNIDEMEVYAYHPAHIDWKAWEPCESCISCENCKNSNVGEFCNPCFRCLQSDKKDGFSPVGFCRKCGRPLTDDAWAELEKRLRG